MPKSLTVVWRYGAAVLAVGAALLICLSLRSILEPSFLFVFLAAAIAAVHFGGLGPGVFAVFLSAGAIHYFMLEPANTFSLGTNGALLLLIYVVVALLVILMSASLRGAKAALDQERAHLLETTRQVQFLQKTAGALVEVTLPEEVADSVLGSACELLGVATGAVYRLLSDGETLELLNKHQFPAQSSEARRISMSSSEPVTDAVRAKQPVFIASVEEYARRYPGAVSQPQDCQVAVALPLVVQDRVIGGLSFCFPSGSPITGDFRALLLAVAHQCAQALQRSLLYAGERRARERLRVTLTSIGDAVIATDIDGYIAFVNPIAERLTGWSAEEAAGKPLNQVFHIVNADTHEIAESPFDKVIQTGAIAGLANHTILLARDGTEVPIDDSGAPIFDEDDVISGVIIVFRDIAERRRDESRMQALQRVTSLFLKTLTVQEVADVVVKQALPLMHAQRGMLALLNETRDGFIVLGQHNLSFRTLQTYETISLDARIVSVDALRSGEPVWLEKADDYLNQYPDSPVLTPDEMHVESAFALPFELESGKRALLSGGFMKPQQFDQATQAFIIAVSRQCAQALDRAFLFEAEQDARLKAEEVNRLKTRFLGMVSHELRTPLTSIKGFATTLLATDVTFDADQQRRFVEVIDAEADKLTELIDQLLDLTRLQANALTINPTRVTLADIIGIAAAQLEMLTHDHHLRLDLPDDLPAVQVDANRIAQVLVNLVGNAAKFSPKDSEITVQARPLGGSLEVRVSDQGPGIPASAHEQVFEAFRQIDNTGVPRDGAGLGLAISRALIEGHGERIWIDPDAQTGAVIVFTLPLYQQAETAPPPE